MVLAGVVEPSEIVDASHAISNLQVELRQRTVIVAAMM